MIAAVVLAAGAGTRFGGPKVMAEHDGVPLVRHVVLRLRAAGIAHVVVIASDHLPGIGDAIEGTEATVLSIPPGSAMSDSLRKGADSLPAACEAFVVALGDQPLIDPEVVTRLVSTWERSNTAAVVPVYAGGVQGHPVLFDGTMRRHFAQLSGDRGARELLQRMGDRVSWITIDAPVPADVDTPDDLRQLGA